MRRYLPLVLVLIILGIAAVIVVQKKQTAGTAARVDKHYDIGSFDRQRQCARPPQFLHRLKIPQPVMIDLSQKRFKGIALLHGKGFKKVLHPKQWEQYGHFSTYTVDEQGHIYLVPTPFISIYPTTFNLQKNIYKLDSKTGKVSIFMHLDDVSPSGNNPYGVNAIVYDCDDHTLWVAAIDESDYREQKGVIYHIDLYTKEILQKVEGVDVLSMALIHTNKGKYLLTGSARDNALYAYSVTKGNLSQKNQKLLTLPTVNEHIRKIKIIGKNLLEIQTIPFSYALIAQTAKEDRTVYHAEFHQNNQWIIHKIP